MKNGGFLYAILLIQSFAIAQVGINTTQPSSASVLHVNSSSDGVNFGGLMPPVVNSLLERNIINPGLSDIGLLVFLKDAVNSNFCFQIWNGSSWEDVYCITTPVIIDIATQDFDANQTWSYSVTPSFYNVGNDIWDIVNTLPDITGYTGNFLGCRDLNNSNGGGDSLHVISFNNVNVSAYTNVQITFEYSVFEFDGGDDVFYEVFFDDVSQGQVQLINGINGGGITENETIVLNVPNGIINARLTVSVIQNGDDDTAGFDNFRVIGL